MAGEAAQVGVGSCARLDTPKPDPYTPSLAPEGRLNPVVAQKFWEKVNAESQISRKADASE
jgi:hypothetical protein